MSTIYWGIVMHGVNENDLKFKEAVDEDEYNGGIDYIIEKHHGGNREIMVMLPNGKKVILNYEPTEEDNFFGFMAGYPWNDYMQGLTEADVDNAIATFLLPYVDMTKQEIVNCIDDISTYNCG